MHDTTLPEPPDYHLAEAYRVDLSELAHMLLHGHTVTATFPTATGTVDRLVTLIKDAHGHDVAGVQSSAPGGGPTLADLKHAH